MYALFSHRLCFAKQNHDPSQKRLYLVDFLQHYQSVRSAISETKALYFPITAQSHNIKRSSSPQHLLNLVRELKIETKLLDMYKAKTQTPNCLNKFIKKIMQFYKFEHTAIFVKKIIQLVNTTALSRKNS